jgi:5'-nucleotidase
MADATARESMARTHDFTESARVAIEVTRKALAEGLPEWTLLNVNIPKGTPKGVRVTRQGFKEAKPVISEHTDPRGKLYYWIGEVRAGFRAEGGTDFEAVDEGYVSVTPMKSDLTNHAALEGMKGWEES